MLGPNLFNINSSELVPLHSNNFYFKFADDATLLVLSSNSYIIIDELSHHKTWAEQSNLKLNAAKTMEMIFLVKKNLQLHPVIVE